MSQNLIATGLLDDPDPEGVDTDGMLALYTEIEDDDSEGEEARAEREDRKEGRKVRVASDSLGAKGGGKGGDKGGGGSDDEDDGNTSPSSFEIETDDDADFTDDENAYDALTARGDSDLSPGEANALINYMRPLSDEELENLKNPLLRDIRWVDDPVHTDDVLKAGKDGHGVDKYLNDASYGETMPAPTSNPKAALARNFYQKLKTEHANFLADDDLAKNLPVRQRAFYENVGHLWTKSVLKGRIPWKADMPAVQAAMAKVLADTQKVRAPYSKALNSSGMEGWGLSSLNPISATKSLVKSSVDVAKKSAGLAYKYTGTKYLVTKAQEAALYPIKKVIRSQTNKIVNKRANAVAKSKGLAKPTPAMYAEAKVWAKNAVRAKNKAYGPLIASLMGGNTADCCNPQQTAFIGVEDDLGADAAGVAKLIALGPFYILNFLGEILKAPMGLISPKKGGAAAPGDAQAPGEGEGEGAQDAGAPGDESDAGPAEGGEPETSDSSGGDPYVVRAVLTQYPQGLTLEQLNQLPTQTRQIIKMLVRQQRIRLR